MGNIFENIRLWKLSTPSDYINLVLFTVFFVSVIWLITAQYKKRRNDTAAVERVCKRLKRAKASRRVVLKNVRLQIDAKSLEADGLLICPDTVYILKCYGWGTVIKGGSQDDVWSFCHGDACRKLANPLIPLNQQAALLSRHLAKSQCAVKVLPLVVFADNFSNPAYYLDAPARKLCCSYQNLGKWIKQNLGTVRENGKMTALLQAIDKARTTEQVI